MSNIYVFALLLSLLSITSLYAQPGTSIANPIEVNTLPYTINNFHSIDGISLTGAGGTCNNVGCCSVKVIKVVVPAPGTLRGEFSAFTPLTGSIIGYTPNVPNPTTWADLTYYSDYGNFCGFRDTVELHNIPAGDYYFAAWTINQQTGQSSGASGVIDITFTFVPDCPLTASCGSVSANVCDGSPYIAPSGQAYPAGGSYTDTWVGGAQSGLDSITYLTLYTGNSFATENQGHIDTSLCVDDTVRLAAATEWTSYGDFSSGNVYANINAVKASLAATDRSAFMWMKQAATVTGASQVLFGINTATGGNVANFQIGTNQELQVFDGGTAHSTGIVVTDGLWHYVGYTYATATGETKVYVDGVEVLTFTNNQNTATDSQYSLGQEYDSGNSLGNFYTGKMTEVSLWNKVLSPAELQLGMQAALETTHPSYANLVAYYPFISMCSPNNAVLTDYSANSYDGTVANNTVLVKTFEEIPNFNGIRWYNKEWSSDNIGTNFSFANNIQAHLTATDSFTLILKRDFISVTETWKIHPRPTLQPEVTVLGNSLGILSGDVTPQTADNTHYGDVLIGSTVSHSFTITNTGNTDLDITDAVLTGVNVSDFTITTSPVGTLSAGASATLTIDFMPTAPVGQKMATVELTTSDCDETSFTFDIEGVGLGALFSEVRGQQIEFNGSSDYVNIDAIAGAMTGVTSFTFEAWINVDAGQVGNDRLFAVNTSGNGSVIFFFLDDGRLETYDGASDTYSSPDLRGTGWHHVVLTHDNSRHRVYLDGVLLDDKAGSVSTFAASYKWSIGQEYDNGGPSDFFLGKMDEVRIWKDVRTQQEIREHMHLSLESANLNAGEDNLVAYYQFDGDDAINTASGVKDVLGNHGTTVGCTYNTSEVAVGKGYAATQTITAAGNYTFGNTDLELNFSGTLPNDEVVVSKIITQLPYNESANSMSNNPGVYWVVNNYGTNTGLTVDAKFNFPNGFITDNTAANHQIHKRGSRDWQVANWTDMAPSTASDANGDNHLLVTLNSFSQLAVSSNTSPFTPSAGGSLPVELLSFQAERMNSSEVQLNWATATEINNKGFEIERMLDDDATFETIAWVAGNGTTTETNYYTYEDNNTYAGVTYYRLKQVDFDGTVSYSEIRAVEGNKQNSSINTVVNVYPNPVSKHVNVQIYNLPEGVSNAQIAIYNLQGQRIINKEVSLDTYQILTFGEVEHLSASTYLMRVELDNGKVYNQKFIKQ